LNHASDIHVKVLDARGRIVTNLNQRLDAGVQVIDLVTEGWSEGQYRVEVSVVDGKELRQNGFRLQIRK
jgi:hypothetical protein